MKILLIHYNNYFNRTIKRLSSVAEYKAIDENYLDFSNVNFNPNDGVYATLTVGTGSIPNYENGGPDYLIAYNDKDEIQNRWFILDIKRTRLGQYELALKRDSVCDFYDDVIDSSAIIERARVPQDNKLIFNKENFSYNQIKKNEMLLQDKTKMPWIIGYISKKAIPYEVSPGDGGIPTPINILYDVENADNIIEVSFSSSSLLLSGGFKYTTQANYNILWMNGLTSGDRYISKFNAQGRPNKSTTYVLDPSGSCNLRTADYLDHPEDVTTQLRETFQGSLGTLYDEIYTEFLSTSGGSGFATKAQWEEIQRITRDGVIIKTTDNKYFKVTLNTASQVTKSMYSPDIEGQAFEDMYSLITLSLIFSADDGHNHPDSNSIKMEYFVKNYSLSYEDVTSTATSHTVISNTRRHTTSCLYDIFAIPYGEIEFGHTSGGTYTKDGVTNSLLANYAAQALGTALGDVVYDVQLLPYCPLLDVVDEEGRVILQTADEHKKFDYIIDNDSDVIGFVYYVERANFEFTIEKELQVERREEFNISNIRKIDVTHGAIPSDIEFYLDFTEMESAVANQSITVRGISNLRVLDKTTGLTVATFYPNRLGFVSQGAVSGMAGHRYLKLYVDTDNGVFEFSGNGYRNSNYAFLVTLSDATVSGSFTPTPENKERFLYMLYYPNLVDKSDIQIKIDSETNFCRLSSPNYQGSFDFCVAKNNGVSGFNVDVTLKPINPYIHVNPIFNVDYLYGGNYRDARGLICHGDFSFGILKDSWVSYEVNNKNYESIFNRGIQSMEVEHGIQRQEALFGAIAGSVSGAATGGGGGAMVGGPIGAIAGAAVGGAASTVGGVLDYANLVKRQTEQKDLAIDMHNFQLDNIKALPYSLTKCPALNKNNKLFPFIEFYTATDEEIETLRKYLELRSFNIGIVDKISNYVRDEVSFIKAQIIRFNSIEASTNIANDIYEELNKGVYL